MNIVICRWVYGGEIDDPYEEFLIQEKKEVKKEGLRDDYRAGFWREHYVLRSTIPAFLAATAETIRTTGKYLNAIRECGEQIKVGVLSSNAILVVLLKSSTKGKIGSNCSRVCSKGTVQ